MTLIFYLLLLTGLNLLLNVVQTFALLSTAYYLKERLFDTFDALAQHLTRLNAIADDIGSKIERTVDAVEAVKQAAQNEITRRTGGALNKIKQALRSPTKEEM